MESILLKTLSLLSRASLQIKSSSFVPPPSKDKIIIILPLNLFSSQNKPSTRPETQSQIRSLSSLKEVSNPLQMGLRLFKGHK